MLFIPKIKIIQSGGNCSCKKFNINAQISPPINPHMNNPLEYLIPTFIDFTTSPINALHRYYIIDKNQYKEVLTVHHYTDPNKGMVRTSLSNNVNNELNTQSNVKELFSSLNSQMITHGTTPNSIHKSSLELVVL